MSLREVQFLQLEDENVDSVENLGHNFENEKREEGEMDGDAKFEPVFVLGADKILLLYDFPMLEIVAVSTGSSGPASGSHPLGEESSMKKTWQNFKKFNF